MAARDVPALPGGNRDTSRLSVSGRLCRRVGRCMNATAAAHALAYVCVDLGSTAKALDAQAGTRRQAGVILPGYWVCRALRGPLAITRERVCLPFSLSSPPASPTVSWRVSSCCLSFSPFPCSCVTPRFCGKETQRIEFRRPGAVFVRYDGQAKVRDRGQVQVLLLTLESRAAGAERVFLHEHLTVGACAVGRYLNAHLLRSLTRAFLHLIGHAGDALWLIELEDDQFRRIWLGAGPERTAATMMLINQILDRMVRISRRIGKDCVTGDIELAGESGRIRRLLWQQPLAHAR